MNKVQIKITNITQNVKSWMEKRKYWNTNLDHFKNKENNKTVWKIS